MTAPRPEAEELAAKLACVLGENACTLDGFLVAATLIIDAALTAAEDKGRSVHGLSCSECGGHMGIGYCMPCAAKIKIAAREEQRERDAALIDRIAGREHGRDQSIMLLCARAIREAR